MGQTAARAAERQRWQEAGTEDGRMEAAVEVVDCARVGERPRARVRMVVRSMVVVVMGLTMW